MSGVDRIISAYGKFLWISKVAIAYCKASPSPVAGTIPAHSTLLITVMISPHRIRESIVLHSVPM